MGSQTWENVLEMDDVRESADFPSDASIPIQSQYAHSPRFIGMSEQTRHLLDATDVATIYECDIADMQTAKGIFLDWWGERIGVRRDMRIKGGYHRFDDD